MLDSIADKFGKWLGIAGAALTASFSLEGVLQLIILVIGIFAAIEAYRRNRLERQLAQVKISKLRLK